MGTLTTTEPQKLDLAVRETRTQLQTAEGFERALVLARAIGMLRKGLEPMLPVLMDLQDSKLGFLTDKKKEGGYPAEVVRDVAIEATLQGARMTGNEVNIIAGNAYLTKEFFVRAMREYPGLTDLCLEFEVPQTAPNGAGALVGVTITFLLDGKPNEMIFNKTEKRDNRICVKVNSGMGADAILGKAERKARARVWQRLTGSMMSDAEIDDGEQVKAVQNLAAVKAQDLLPRAKTEATGQSEVKPILKALSAEAQEAVTVAALDEITTRVRATLSRGEITSDESGKMLAYIAKKRAAIGTAQTTEAEGSQEPVEGPPDFAPRFAKCKTIEEVNAVCSDLVEQGAPREFWVEVADKRRKALAG